MTDFKIKEDLLCPSCGYKLEIHTGLQSKDDIPSLGDFTICLSCGDILRFDSETKISVATQKDLNELQPEDHKKALLTSFAIKEIQSLSKKSNG